MKNFLNTKQLQVINSTQIEDYCKDRLRDIFIVCNLYGLSLSEAALLTKESLYSDDNGNEFLILNRQDNKYPKLPLTKFAKLVLSRFDGNQYCQIMNTLLPISDASILNQHMPSVLKSCNIENDFTAKMTKNTFYENVYYNKCNDALSNEFGFHYFEILRYFIKEDNEKVKATTLV